MATTDEAAAPSAGSADATQVAWYALEPGAVTERLNVSAASGLSGAEAASRLACVGPNKFAEVAVEPRWRAFVRQYRDPMQIVLLIAGIGSLYPLKELGTGLVLLFLTLFNAVLGLRQEGKAAEAVAALQKMMIIKARVKRDGELVQIPAEELVPGDIVSIEAGDLVPADGRLLSAATLEIAEAALTGESLPVSKGVESVVTPDTPLGDRTDMVFMNTNVTRGSGSFVVTSTGMTTEVGHISHMLQSADDADTPLTIQLKKLTSQILVIAGAAVAVSVVLNLSRDQSFDTVFTAAIAFAISAIPTGLPAVVTTILSYGTQMLAKANAIMKRLRSTETLGSTSAINSDKTGTLTLNQMTAVEMTIPGRRYTISGGGYSTEGTIKHVFGPPEVPLEQFLLPMALCADAVVKDGGLVGDPTEGALVVLAEKGGLDAVETRRAYPARRRAAVRRRVQDDGDVPRDAGRERPRRRPLPRQGRPGPAARARGVPARSRGPLRRAGRRGLQAALHGRERAARSSGPARDGDRTEGLRSGRVRSVRRPASAARRDDGARPGRDRRSPAPGGEGGDRGRARGRDPGAHDHGRSRRDGRSDRGRARHHRPCDQRRGIQGDVGQPSSTRRSTRSA